MGKQLVPRAPSEAVLNDIMVGQRPVFAGLYAEVKRAGPGDRAPNGDAYDVRIRASTAVLARDGGVIPVNAWKRGGLKHYKHNPVVQFAHNHFQPPVGIAVHTEIDSERDALVQWWRFHEETEISRTLKTLYMSGFMRAASVGFIVREAHVPSEDEERELQATMGTKERVYWVADRAELLEVSAVPVGSDPNALVMKTAITSARAHSMAGGIDALEAAWHKSLEPADAGRRLVDGEYRSEDDDVNVDETRSEEEVVLEEEQTTEEVAKTEEVTPPTVEERIDRIEEQMARLANSLGELRSMVENPPEAELVVTEPEAEAEAKVVEQAAEAEERELAEGEHYIELMEGETKEEALARIAERYIQERRGAPRS